jgi:predicted DNA-binding antitoxin AbrB/MazE fold protein
MMQPIIAIYENGVFRPLDPVELPEGARVEVSPVGHNGVQSGGEGQRPTATKPLMGEALAALLDEFEALPYTPHPDGRTDISVNHDEILYPKHGGMP